MLLGDLPSLNQRFVVLVPQLYIYSLHTDNVYGNDNLLVDRLEKVHLLLIQCALFLHLDPEQESLIIMLLYMGAVDLVTVTLVASQVD